MEFRVLGDVEVRAAGRRVEAGHARQRAVLAVLLFDLGRVVPVTRLIDRVWGDDPPASVRNVLDGYVANLRTAIAKDGAPDVTMTRQSGGYRLDAGQDQVDLHRFRRLLADAAAAAGDDRRAGVLLTGALELRRGTALAGLDSPWLNRIREALELQRRTAVLDLGDIALRRGSHRTLAVSLAEEAVHCPTDERLIGQLMLALYRCGQQAEALQWFEQTCAADAQARRLARKHRGPRRNRPTAQLPAPAGTTLTSIYSIGPVIAATIIGDVEDITRFHTCDAFAERTLARTLFPVLEEDWLLIADRNFYGWADWQAAAGTGAALLWRVISTVRLPVLRDLPDGSYLGRSHRMRSGRQRR